MESWKTSSPACGETIPGRESTNSGANVARWREQSRQSYAKSLEDYTDSYEKDKTLQKAIAASLDKVRQPSELYQFCDDLAAQLIEEDGKHDPIHGLALAKAKPGEYLCTWTFSLLVRIGQFAQTVPKPERAKGPFGAYAKLLKADENDAIDATIACPWRPLWIPHH